MSLRCRHSIAALLFILLGLPAVIAGGGNAMDITVLYNDTLRPYWLEHAEARQRLRALLTELGHHVTELSDVSAWPQHLRETPPDLVIYGPCEVVPEPCVEPLRAYLRGGGRLVTEGGLPFYSVGRFDAEGYAETAQYGYVRVLGARGFIGLGKAEPRWTAFGRMLLGDPGEDRLKVGYQYSIIPVVDQDVSCVPMAWVDNGVGIGALRYPHDGRFFFVGMATRLEDGLFNPAAPAGQARWKQLLDWMQTPLPDIAIDVRRTWVNGADTNVAIVVQCANSTPNDLRTSLVLTVDWWHQSPVHSARWTLDVPAGERVLKQSTLSLPASDAWGIYGVKLTCADGPEQDANIHVLPAAAAAYIDVARPFDTGHTGMPMPLRLGFRRFADRTVEVAYRVEVSPDVDGPFESVTEGQLVLEQPGVTEIAASDPTGAGPRVYRLTVLLDGREINAEAARCEPGPRTATQRTLLCSRSMDGYQVMNEDGFWDSLDSVRKAFPLLRELQVFRYDRETEQAVRAHELELNAGFHIGGQEGVCWGLEDIGPNGENAYDASDTVQQGEDKTLWMTQQYSRRLAREVIDMRPDRINFVEPVACFSSAADGPYSGFYGYGHEAVAAYREALQSRDAGIALLAPDDRTVRRMHFPAFYHLVYDEPLPSPADVGFASWAAYEPIRLTQSQWTLGAFNDWREILLTRLHLLMRAYFNLWQLDRLSTYVRVSVPEVMIIPNSDGTMNGQFTYLFYRLPYMDTIYREMFRGAYWWGIDNYTGENRTWPVLADTFGKRIRLSEEVRGGSPWPYRTPATSFVSAFTKRAGIAWPEMQTDFYTTLTDTYGRRIEASQYAGYSLAADLNAAPFWKSERDLLILGVNPSYYPELWRGFYRWDMRMPEGRLLEAADSLRRAGQEFDSYFLPFPGGNMDVLKPYRTVVLNAAAQPGGTFEALNTWLQEPSNPPRVLVLNHIGFQHLSMLNGADASSTVGLKPSRWQALGLPAVTQQVAWAEGFAGCDGTAFPSRARLAVFTSEPPSGAVKLLATAAGACVTWQYTLPSGNCVAVSGLPMNLVTAREDPSLATERAWQWLFETHLGHHPRMHVSLPEHFVGLYRTSGNVHFLAAIRREEADVAMAAGKYTYNNAGELAKVVGDVPRQILDVDLHGFPSNSHWSVYDVVDGRELGETVAGDQGSLRLNFEIHLVRLLALAPNGVERSPSGVELGRYRELWHKAPGLDSSP